MPIPTPEPGLVISYSYVWAREALSGQDEGRKNRPCVVAMVVERQENGETLVTVLPVTHYPPNDTMAAVEIPQAVKRHLSLDDSPSWVVVTEGDQFVWPGHDLRRVRGSDRYDYGFLPPRFFNEVLIAFRAWHKTHKVKLTSRS